MSGNRLPLLVVLGLVFAGSAPLRAVPRVAVLLGKDIKIVQRAAAALDKESTIDAQRFELHKGTREIDRTLQALRSGRYSAAVGLGATAHTFLQNEELGVPYASTLVLSGGLSERVVPYGASDKGWADLMAKLLPAGAGVGVLVRDKAGRNELRGFAEALRRVGLKLVIQETRGKPVSTVLPALLKRCRAFFFQRNKLLMKKQTALAILKGTHAARIPIFAFSRALVKAGALAALELSPEKAAQLALARALGQSSGGVEADLTLNMGRAKYVGVAVPPELMARAKGP